MRNFKIDKLLLIIGLLTLLGCKSKNSSADSGKPNIILIVADDLGYGDLGCYGNDLVDTPELDKLASNGVRFTNAYASCTVCSPTRASLLTGKNPVALNLTDFIPGRQANGPKPYHKLISPNFNKQLPLDEITIAEKLKPLGYTNASIGKWHLGAKEPTEHGFDINIGGNHYGMPPSYYYPYTSNEKWRTHQITNLEISGDSLYLTDRLTNEAINFIKSHQSDPFFLYLSYYTVHIPLEGKKVLVEKYMQILKEVKDSSGLDADYLAMIESLDQNVGRIVDLLNSTGLVKNTIVFFVSDNGGWATVDKQDGGDQIYSGWEKQAASNYPLRGGKGTLYEGGLRVPTIISWPENIAPGRTSAELIISTDIFPTIMDLVDVPIEYPIEGVSMLPYLFDNNSIDRETLVWHYPHYHLTSPGSAIREENYKLIKYYEDDRLELYNLDKDRGETNNLIDQFPDKADRMHKKLNLWLEKNGAKTPVPNPDFINDGN